MLLNSWVRQLFVPLEYSQGTAADIAIHAREILAMRSSLNNLYATHTGQPLSAIGEYARMEFTRLIVPFETYD